LTGSVCVVEEMYKLLELTRKMDGTPLPFEALDNPVRQYQLTISYDSYKLTTHRHGKG
jgi:hypothetical protein